MQCNKISFDTNGNKFTNIALFSFLFQLLQNLGKADKTTDEIFEEHLLNFNQQQANSTRLQKDIANYIRCIKGITYLYRSPYIIIKGKGRQNWKGAGGAYKSTCPPPPPPIFACTKSHRNKHFLNMLPTALFPPPIFWPSAVPGGASELGSPKTNGRAKYQDL